MNFLLFFSICYFLYVTSIGMLFNNYKVLLIFSLIPPTIVSVIRYNVGIDFMSYVDYFNQLKYTDEIYLDDTFKYISYFSYYIGGNEQIVFLIYAIFYSAALYFLIKLVLENYMTRINNFYVVGLLLSFYSFYFLLSFNQIRSSLSALLLCYGLLKRKKDFSFVMAILLSVLFHSAAMFILPFYVALRKIKVGYLLVIFPFLLVASFYNIFSDVLKFILTFLNSRFLTYFYSEYFVPKTGMEKMYSVISMTIVLGMVVCLFKLLPEKFDLMIKFVILFVLLRAMSIDILIFARISDFLKPITIILVFTAIYFASNKVTPRIILPIYLIMILLLCLFNIKIGSNITKDDHYTYGYNICLFGNKCVEEFY
ncbi:EpsG family protein [Escherichia albertii]|uniref:Wzy n=1 Tax=Escherichia albertii TaxID=208962 RepID=A0A288W4A0_ESCAL|nr:EpsG family protein [Escherichia albertii]ARO72713.1 Wzy [Escherichia albertii]BBM62442.1 O-antigen polymerase [Escherichia albertii]